MKPFFLEFHVEYESLMFKASISKLYNAQTYADPNEPYFHLHARLKMENVESRIGHGILMEVESLT